MDNKFPKGFLWGAATSAYQVEGGIVNSWTEWEKNNAIRLSKKAKDKYQKWQQEKFPEMLKAENYISGRACDHYSLFESDFDLAKEGGHTAHRFSIEWARIEPEEGKFSKEEVEHYRRVIFSLKERGIEPFVTLWHWTEPVWVAEKGGWKNGKTREYFLRFVEKIVSEFKEDVKFWLVVNEPNVSLGFGYFLGMQPPGKKGPYNLVRAYFNLLKAYKDSYNLIHVIDNGAKVGFAHSFTLYESGLIWPLDRIAIILVEYFSKYFIRKAKYHLDFIGCNYYTRYVISLKKRNFKPEEISDLGWEIYPRGIYDTLMSLKEYNLPVYVTENGLADASDSKRPDFIKKHLKWVNKAIENGVDIRGYFHWSLMDNFEFPEIRGFWPRFGLVEIDYKTLERKPRKSFYEYKKIIQNSGL
jgi:beta-glucosidase